MYIFKNTRLFTHFLNDGLMTTQVESPFLFVPVWIDIIDKGPLQASSSHLLGQGG